MSTVTEESNALEFMELWAIIPEYPDYLVSNWGRVQSKRRGGAYKVMKGSWNRVYRQVTLRNEDPEATRSYSVHRLVAICFLGHSFEDESVIVDHINGEKGDYSNHVDNLQLISHRQNPGRKVCHL